MRDISKRFCRINEKTGKSAAFPVLSLTSHDGLLSVMLIRNGQLLAAFGTTRGKHATTILCSHSLTETVLVDSSAVVGLECSFHF